MNSLKWIETICDHLIKEFSALPAIIVARAVYVIRLLILFFISSPGGKMSAFIMQDVQQAEQSFHARLCKGKTHEEALWK